MFYLIYSSLKTRVRVKCFYLVVNDWHDMTSDLGKGAELQQR